MQAAIPLHYQYTISVYYSDCKAESYKEVFLLDVCPPNRRQLNKFAVSLVRYNIEEARSIIAVFRLLLLFRPN